MQSEQNKGRGKGGGWLAHQRFGYKPGDFPLTDAVCKSTLALPFHNHLTADDVDFVCNQLKTCLDELT
ncbi:DegT/DnrJ/EryC1/StrS family aminotransferase [Candidatus Pacearchaeota archaeon]|nr:DegT/DnrJ/EryC1/StrS family aminotransferase [Candidatus Pacearchaeota archaeon]